MCLANILNLGMFVFAVEEVAQFSVHIPVTYKYCMVYVVTFSRAEYNAVLPPITLSE